MSTINIAKVFTKYPGPRYSAQGESSGEEFREKYLKPAFERVLGTDEYIVVQLDGVSYGYPTSFLEEAFGGLAREFGQKPVLDKLRFESASEPLLENEIRIYIEECETKSTRSRGRVKK